MAPQIGTSNRNNRINSPFAVASGSDRNQLVILLNRINGLLLDLPSQCFQVIESEKALRGRIAEKGSDREIFEGFDHLKRECEQVRNSVDRTFSFVNRFNQLLYDDLSGLIKDMEHSLPTIEHLEKIGGRFTFLTFYHDTVYKTLNCMVKEVEKRWIEDPESNLLRLLYDSMDNKAACYLKKFGEDSAALTKKLSLAKLHVSSRAEYIIPSDGISIHPIEPTLDPLGFVSFGG